MIACLRFYGQAFFGVGREGHLFESQGGNSAGGVHEEIERVEGTTEEGNAEVLKELDGRPEQEDCRGAEGRKAKGRRAVKADPEKQNE